MQHAPATPFLPDYSGGSLANLIASLAAACGGTPSHPALRILAPGFGAAARNVVLLLMDGLGDAFLTTRGAGSELARRRHATLTSVFPSTTASAITTSLTGVTPIEHGLTGWFTYFGAAHCVAAPLPFQPRGSRLPLTARGVRPSQIFRAAPMLDSLATSTCVVTYRPLIDSHYSRHHYGRAARYPYDDLAGFVDQVEAAVKSGDQRKFVYAYWPEFDTTCHRYGVGSAEALAQFAAIDAAYAELLRRLSGTDTLLVATADHGFIDSAPEESLHLEDGPGLASLLRFPLCGEPRVAFCHVRQGSAGEFMARAADWLGDRARVCASGELVGEGWFGGGSAHPAFAERIGDVALVMRERYTLKDRAPGEPRHRLIGNHGGTSADEMMIPLVLAQT